MRERKNKITEGDEKDIHERNAEFMKESYENARFLIEKYDWKRIECSKKGKGSNTTDLLLSIEEIHEKIYKEIEPKL